MTDVLLFDPGQVSESWYAKRQCPNLGLAYIATLLKSKGHEVGVLDVATYGLSVDDIKESIEYCTPEVIGVSAASFNILDAYLLLKLAKSMGCFTILGGSHASAVPEKCLAECNSIDAIVIGEGEQAMLDICEQPVPGIYRYPFNDQLDELPFPDWRLFDYYLYEEAYSHYHATVEHLYPIVTSRGCPFQCKFCYPLHGRKVRFRSPENVISEIIYDYNTFGSRFFYIADSEFTVNKKHVQAICKGLIKQNLDISYKCQSRVDLVDRETLRLLKESHCELIFFGIESGVQEILDKANKQITLDQIRTAVKTASEEGLIVRGSFILGLDGETRDTAYQTLKFARELKTIGLDQAQFHCLDLYPGTEFYGMVERGEGTLKSPYDINDWTVFSREMPHVISNDLTLDELKTLKYLGDNL